MFRGTIHKHPIYPITTTSSAKRLKKDPQTVWVCPHVTFANPRINDFETLKSTFMHAHLHMPDCRFNNEDGFNLLMDALKTKRWSLIEMYYWYGCNTVSDDKTETFIGTLIRQERHNRNRLVNVAIRFAAADRVNGAIEKMAMRWLRFKLESISDKVFTEDAADYLAMVGSTITTTQILPSDFLYDLFQHDKQIFAYYFDNRSDAHANFQSPMVADLIRYAVSLGNWDIVDDISSMFCLFSKTHYRGSSFHFRSPIRTFADWKKVAVALQTHPSHIPIFVVHRYSQDDDDLQSWVEMLWMCMWYRSTFPPVNVSNIFKNAHDKLYAQALPIVQELFSPDISRHMLGFCIQSRLRE